MGNSRLFENGPGPKSEGTAEDLALQPGETVRIKSVEAIKRTLDENGRLEGVYFMKDAMEKYCGGTYRVKKRVAQFFDERRGRLLRPRNVVILDGVFCETHGVCSSENENCDRTCFLFWKEAWLEKIRDDGKSL